MISFIIPTLNEGKVIEKTLRNLSEYNGEKEIIISDGKSTDETIAICRKYTDKIVIYDKPERQTIALARNMGAEQARGEFLVFLDADVFIPEINNFFPKVLNIFSTNNILGIIPSVRVFPELETIGDKVVFGTMDYAHAFLNNLTGIGGAPGEFQIIRKAGFEAVSGFNSKMAVAEDHDFLRRLARVGAIRFEKNLRVYHTGRRAHKVGWPRLLFSWTINGVYTIFSGKARDTEWKEIR